MNHTKHHKVAMAGAGVALLAISILGGFFIGNRAEPDTKTTSTLSLSQLSDRASATEHNDADIMFAQMMVPHHKQAVEMSKLASTRAESAEVKTLAATIEAAQQPEIDKMSGWIQAWDETVGMMDHSAHGGMKGMMTMSAIDELAAKSGADFDRAFMTMMIEHHEGAMEMAKNEVTDGKNAEALALAAAIQVTQQAEVAQMKALLN